MKAATKMPGGAGGETISALRKRIASLALPHVEGAVKRIVALMDADRESVAMQACVTVLELADDGGASLETGKGGEQPKAKLVVIDRRQVSDTLSERLSKESDT